MLSALSLSGDAGDWLELMMLAHNDVRKVGIDPYPSRMRLKHRSDEGLAGERENHTVAGVCVEVRVPRHATTCASPRLIAVFGQSGSQGDNQNGQKHGDDDHANHHEVSIEHLGNLRQKGHYERVFPVNLGVYFFLKYSK